MSSEPLLIGPAATEAGACGAAFASEAFERFVTFTAASTRRRFERDRDAALRGILVAQGRRWALSRSVAHGWKAVRCEATSRLEERLREQRPSETILACYQFGSPVACAIELARRGYPITIPYLALSPTAARGLRHAGVDLVDLREFACPRRAVSHLVGRRREGRLVSILVDAPHPGRRRLGFLGFEVAVSNLVAVLAREAGSRVLPVFSRFMGNATPEMDCIDALESPGEELAQRLLIGLETLVLRDPAQYDWRLSSPIYTDAAANRMALQCAPACLADRARLWEDLELAYGGDARCTSAGP